MPSLFSSTGKRQPTDGPINGSQLHHQSAMHRMSMDSEANLLSSLQSSNINASRADWKRTRKAKREAKREAKVVQKSAAHVDKIVSELTNGLPFLQNTPNQPIAKFLRSEIVVGNLLGRGVFVRVYIVKDFDLADDEEEAELTAGFPPNANVQEALDEAARLVLDSSSSEQEETPDAQPFGSSSLEQRPKTLGELHVIAESESDHSPQQVAPENPDDSTTAGTSSTAPASAPSTPPLTPQEHPESQPPRTRRTQQRPNNLRFSTANYQQHLMSESRQINSPSALRLRARDVIRSGTAGYTLKHLTKTLLRNPRDFHLAAAALVMEAKYLAKLNHPNIVKVTGVAMGSSSVCIGNSSSVCIGNNQESTKQRGNVDNCRRRMSNSGPDPEGLESGHYDSYFLLSERLTDTLDRRIRQWKRDQPTHKQLTDQSSTQKIQTWKHMMRKTSYALQISNALGHLHERRLLHRDVKPQNIGFIGDNQTICLFNFGLCRELNPQTNTVKEDDVTALYGALSWKYTAVECFPQPIVHTTGDFLAISARISKFTSSNHSSESFVEPLSRSLSSSFRLRKSTSKRRHNVAPTAMQEIQRELRVVPEQHQDEMSDELAIANAAAATPPFGGEGSNNDPRKTMTTPEYDVKADVYSWAMVYYEMLTLNQPFSGITQKQHLRKVAGPKGGQRPGVYQFDLTPSMISLLQRAWDQNPKMRPTMESVAANLQLILKELEQLIKDEQKALLKAAGGTADAVKALTSKEERAARRAKRKEEKQKARKKKTGSLVRKSSLINVLKKASDGVFARNRYREGDVPESVMEPRTGLLGPIPRAIPGLEDMLPRPSILGSLPTSIADLEDMLPRRSKSKDAEDQASTSDVDMDALEYECCSIDDEYEDSESASFELESEEGSSVTDHLDTVVTINNDDAANADLDVPVDNSPESSNHDKSEDDVGDAISKFSQKKRLLPGKERNLSGHSESGGRAPHMRRKTKAESIKARRTLFGALSMERRGTGRANRRTMRLSRASILMMNSKFKALFYTMLVLSILVLSYFSYAWYKRYQATWLGLNLDDLGKRYNETEVRAILRTAMKEDCRPKLPTDHDPNALMLFQGGALSPVDLDCMENLERLLEIKMVRVTGFDPSKVVAQEVGFLGVKKFAKPPPQPKKSRWKRKKAWKFFREEEAKPVPKDDNANGPKPLAGSQVPEHVDTTCQEDPPPKSEPAIDGSPPKNSKENERRERRARKVFRGTQRERFALEEGQIGLLGVLTATSTVDFDSKTEDP